MFNFNKRIKNIHINDMKTCQPKLIFELLKFTHSESVSYSCLYIHIFTLQLKPNFIQFLYQINFKETKLSPSHLHFLSEVWFRKRIQSKIHINTT